MCTSGTTFADVNTASRTDPKGVLASQGQTETTFDPAGLLAYGQTYYWRIDEVNTAARQHHLQGQRLVLHRRALWLSGQAGGGHGLQLQPSMGPEKTIDGSGLTGDLHGTERTTMWLSTGVQPNWIQYEFDKVYKLYDLMVWNSNQLIEASSASAPRRSRSRTPPMARPGRRWPTCRNSPGHRLPGYAANTTVNLGGVMAKFVKLTINSTWGGISPVDRPERSPVLLRPGAGPAPQPATAATGVGVDAALNWRPGREAGSHKVFFGTDQAAVADGTAAAKTVTDHSFTPGSLNFGTTYYWKVDEVNAVTYPGEVWSFTTQEYAVVEDFESYNDDDNRIFDAWVDGLTDSKSGSIVGYMDAPFASRRSFTAASSPCRSSTTTSRRRTTPRPSGPSTHPGLDDQRRRHPVAVLPGPGRGLCGQGQQRLHREQQRHRHLGQRRSVPLCLQAAQRRRLDHGQGGQHRQHQRWAKPA